MIRLPSVLGFTGENKHFMPANCASIAQHPVRHNELYIGTNGFCMLYDVRQTKHFQRQFGPTDRTKPYNYPTALYGTGAIDRHLATGVQIRDNQLLVNFLSNAVLLYNCDSETTIETPFSTLTLHNTVTDGYSSARKAKKKAKKMKLDDTVSEKEEKVYIPKGNFKSEKVKELKTR